MIRSAEGRLMASRNPPTFRGETKVLMGGSEGDARESSENDWREVKVRAKVRAAGPADVPWTMCADALGNLRVSRRNLVSKATKEIREMQVIEDEREEDARVGRDNSERRVD